MHNRVSAWSLPLLVCLSEHQLRGLRPLEVEMNIVVFREAHAAVKLVAGPHDAAQRIADPGFRPSDVGRRGGSTRVEGNGRGPQWT